MVESTPVNASGKPSSQQGLLLMQTAIAIATVPALLTLIGATALAETLQNLGEWSEEWFRGDRLPLLNLPAAPPPEP